MKKRECVFKECASDYAIVTKIENNLACSRMRGAYESLNILKINKQLLLP